MLLLLSGAPAGNNLVRTASDSLAGSAGGGLLMLLVSGGGSAAGITEGVVGVVTPGSVAPSTGGGRLRDVTWRHRPLHFAVSAGESVEFLYADAQSNVTESDEWLVLDMPELVS